jgi:hypothetical protein
MRSLNDAGVSRLDLAEIDELLDRDGISLVCMPARARIVFA